MTEPLEKISAKQLRFIVREFVELKKLLKEVREAEESSQKESVSALKREISKILRHLRGGIFAGEERIEYRLAANYRKLSEILSKTSSEINAGEYRKINQSQREANIYNAKLEKLGARGGEIEQALREAKDDPTKKKKLQKAEQLIEEAMQADQSFEAAVKELFAEAKKIKVVKGQLHASEHYDKLALSVFHSTTTASTKIVLYYKDGLKKVFEDYHHLLRRSHGDIKRIQVPTMLKMISKRELKEYEASIEATTYDEHRERERKLNYTENRILKEVIIGYCELVSPYPKYKFCGALEIFRIAARKGFGPFFFELVFSYVSLKKHPVVIDRKNVSPAARKVWAYYDTSRRHVISYPAALYNYPELIGFTEEEALKVFGSSGVRSSVFDNRGYPANMPKAKRDELIEKYNEKIFREEKSFLEKEGKRKDNRITGGLASLDKAYYYDGETRRLKALLARGKDASGMILEQLMIAGEAFFKYSKPRSGLPS